MSPATPGQAAGVDPRSTAYRVHAHAFNKLSEYLCTDARFVPLSVRDAIASAVVEAVEPIIRADERAIAAREPHAADGNAPELRITDCSAHGDALHIQVNTGHNWLCAVALAAILAEYEPQPEPQPAPGPADAIAESHRYRDALQEVRAIILEGGNSTEGSRLRRSRAVIRKALEGK